MFKMSVLSHPVVLLTVPLRETEFLADVDLLAARELELAPSESLDHLGLELVMASDRDEDLSDPDPGRGAVSLPVGSSHSCLEPISLSTWKGCTLILMWNPSLPQFLTRYLLQQILAASRASEDSCSSSSETRCTERGNSSTPAFFLPKSKILILGSGTPLLNLLLG